MKKFLVACVSVCCFLCCSACDAHTHILVKTGENAPTCTATGNNAYWTCWECGKVFADKDGKQETTVAEQTLAATDHDYDESKWGYKGEDGHAHECVCGEHDTVQEHTPGEDATETTSQLCSACGYELAPILGHMHVADTEWKHSDTHHWQECVSQDGYKMNETRHVFETVCDTTCDCGYTRTVEHVYSNACDASCNTEGCGQTRIVGDHINENGDAYCDECFELLGNWSGWV